MILESEYRPLTVLTSSFPRAGPTFPSNSFVMSTTTSSICCSMSGPSSTFTSVLPLSGSPKNEPAVYEESCDGRYPLSGNFLGRRRFGARAGGDLERLASWLDVEDHGAGTLLTHEGRTSYAFFVL